jgi:hypothetical protein
MKRESVYDQMTRSEKEVANVLKKLGGAVMQFLPVKWVVKSPPQA